MKHKLYSLLMYQTLPHMILFDIPSFDATRQLRSTFATSKRLAEALFNRIQASTFLVICLLLLSPSIAHAQWTEQIGDNLFEVGSRDFGGSMALSADGKVLAVADPEIDSDQGKVSVYRRDGFSWSKIGNDILGPTVINLVNKEVGFRFGSSIALSADGSIMAIGVPGWLVINDPNHLGKFGGVMVYSNNNGTWEQVGSTVFGTTVDELLGTTVALSADGTILAAGGIEHDNEETPTNIFTNAGIVRVYDIDQEAGSIASTASITGNSNNQYFGASLDLSADGKAMVIGAIHPSSTISGIAKVYRKFSRSWKQVGDNLTSEVSGDRFGNSVAISSNGSVVAVGAPNSRGDENELGYAKVYGNSSYTRRNSTWAQKGSNITAGTGENNFGISIDLSADGNIIAIVAGPLTTPSMATASTYQYTDDAWVLYGQKQNSGNLFSTSVFPTVSLSAASTLMAFGVRENNGTSGAGVVRVFGDCPEGTTCQLRDVDACGTSFTTDGGHEIFEDATFTETVGNTRTTYFVSFGKAQMSPEVFVDATMAESGMVTYEANTNATGVLSFDKTQNYWVDMNALQDDLNATSRSIFMWIKSEANVTSGEQILFGINPANNGNTIANLFIDDSGDNLEVNDGGSNRNASFDVSGEVWNHVGYTYDVNTNETVIYVNGISQITYTNDQSTTATSRYSLGQEFDNNESNHYNGDMSEISVWNEVLTGAEIRQVMKEKITNTHPKSANLMGYYSVFGECNDNTAILKDHSGKGNDGVMQNGFTVDFRNVQLVEGFNAIGWYPNVSWKREGVEVATTNSFTTQVAEGSYEFTALSDFIQSTNTWTLAQNENATTVDNLTDETLCSDGAITRTTTDINKVNYLDFEEDDKTGIEINSITDNLIGKDRSVFMWVNKESSVGSNDVFSLVTFNGFDAESDISRLFIRSDERLNIWDGDTRLGGTTALENDTWYHVGYTYDATTFETKLYVDGILEATGTREMPVAEGYFASLGNSYIDNGRDDFLDGKMADVTVWDKLLTEAEITAIMGTAPAHNATNLVGTYGTLQSVADNRLFDLTANGNDGVASHSSIFVSDMEEIISGYDPANNYIFSWSKDNTELDTSNPGTLTVEDGDNNFTVQYGLPFFQKTDAFVVNYTNLVSTQPSPQSAVVSFSATFEVDEINGASYQWFEGDPTSAFTFDENGVIPDRTANGTSDIESIAISGDVYVVGTDDGLNVSIDGGETWIHFDNTTSGFGTSNDVLDVAVDGNNIYAATRAGISISSDRGTSWTHTTNGQNGLVARFGRVDNVYVDNGTVYAYASSTISKSVDSGSSWTSVAVNFPDGSSPAVEDLFVDDDNIYLSTKTSTGNTASGLIFSMDAGTTWSLWDGASQLGFSNTVISDAVSATGQKIFLGTREGLAISDDGGATWANGSDRPGYEAGDATVNSVVSDNGILYAITTTGVYKSTNLGATWSRTDLCMGTSTIRLFAADGGNLIGDVTNALVAVKKGITLTDGSDDTTDNYVSGATAHQLTIDNLTLDNNGKRYYVTVSRNGCEQTSEFVKLEVLQVPILSSFTPVNGATDVSLTTGLELTYENTIAQGAGLLRIFENDTDTEKGSSLVTVSGAVASITESTFTLDYDTKYYVLLDADLVKDSDGNPSLAVTDKDLWTFTTACEPLITTQPADQSGVTGGSVTFSVPEVTGASYQWYTKEEIRYTTTTSGENGFANNDLVLSVYAEGDKVYAGTRGGGLSISTDGGLNWTTTITNQNGFAASSFVFSVYAEGDKVYAGTAGISISTDGGLNWTTTTVNQNGFSNGGETHSVYAEGDKVYAGTSQGLSISTDGGLNWTTTILNQNGFAASSFVNSVYAEGDKVYAGTKSGLSISTNGGDSWTTTTSGQNGFAASGIVNSVYAEGDNVSVGTEAGLSISTDGGLNWTTTTSRQNGFATNSRVTSVYTEGDKVYAATFIGGLSISTDGGLNWETITSGQNGFASSNTVRSVYAESGRIYAATHVGLSISIDRALLADEPDNTASNQITGATTRELTINNLTSDLDQKEYFVVVTKGDCEETSSTVTLTVSVGPPVITTLSPADDEEEVARFTSPAITFDKAISKGSGIIEVRRASDDQLLTTIGANSVLVSISDKTATIRLGDSRFEFGTEYYITIPEGAFNSTDGGVFEGISDKTTWSFTIEAKVVTYTSLSPADDAIEVGLTPTLELNFDGPSTNDLLEHTTGNILIKKVSDDAEAASIDVAGDAVEISFVIFGPTGLGFETNIKISLENTPLDYGTEYYVEIPGTLFKTFTDDFFQGITDKTTWNFTTEDAPELLVSSLTPADDAIALQPGDLNTNLPTSSVFRVTFDQPIEYNNTNASFELYTASDDQLVASQTLASTISGPAIGDFSTLNFAFASHEFQTSTEYYILMDAGMVKSKASGVEFAGITDKTTWSFATAADPFAYTNLLPSTQFGTGENVPLNLSEPVIGFIPGHIITFSGLGYTQGNTGKLGLYSSADDGLIYEIDLATDPIVFDPEGIENFGKVSVLSFDGDNTIMVITDEVLLNSNTQYYWLVNEGILLNSEAGRFAGISDKTDWSFTTKTVETSPLELSGVIPQTDETLDLGRDVLTLFFRENIIAGSGTLTIFNGSDDSVFETLNISDFEIRNTGNPKRARAPISKRFELGVTYYVQFPEGFIKSEDGTKSLATIDDQTTFSFGTTLADAIFEEFSPAPGSTTYDVSKGRDFEIVTSEDITDSELEPVGAIRIYRASDNTLVKTIEYEGENDGDLDYPGEDDELAIEFSRNELEPDTEYYVLIDDGLIVSYDEPQYHAGISSPNTWRFRTAALPTTPVITSTNPFNNSTGVSAPGTIEITFSENIRANTGNVVIHDASGTVFETIPVSAIGISATQATITPTNNFGFSTTYYVLIETTAFESSNGVAFAGISDQNTLRFTTEAMPNTAPVASAQSFTGNPEVNQQLTGSYDYSDGDTDPEDGSVYQWFMADDASGNNASIISGATAENYTLTAGKEGKFIALAITPFDGEDAGQQVFTSYQGPIIAAVMPTLISNLPLDGAVDIATNTNLNFVLSESVTKGTGSIRVTTAGGSQTVFDVASAEVTVSGTDVTINPSNDLSAGQFYTVTFDASAFVDSDGNNSAGLTSATRWNFTTEDANVAPEATGVNVNQSLVVSGELDGSYTYSDGNGDTESGTTYQWYRADDIDGMSRTAIAGATTEAYTAMNDDDGKFVSFEVTPNDGTLTGFASESAFFGPVLVNNGSINIPPAFTSDALTRIIDNQDYSYTVTFEDLNNDTPVLTETTGPDWLSVTDFVLSGSPTNTDVGIHLVVLTLDDQNGGTVIQEFAITVLASNTAPSVSGIEITGTTTIDQQLTGSYNFLDNEDDADNSSLEWYRADDANGTNRMSIAGATGTTYTLLAADAGKFISFEVTPNDGTIDGTVAESTVVGEVAKKIPTLTLDALTKTYGDADFDLSASTNSSSAITYTFDNDQTGANLNGSTVTLGSAGTIMVDVSLVEDAEFQARAIQSTVTVSKKAVEFTATDANKNIGENDPQLSFTITSGGVIGSDAVVTVSRGAGEEAGTYAMTFTEGADAGNYDISTVNGTFTITQRAITITADAATRTYGTTDPDFTFNITSGELAAGDELSGIITREEGEDVGIHALQSSLFNSKYRITFVPANLTIGKADLSIAVNDQSRNFGEAIPELTLSYDGLANGDTNADFDTPAVATTTANASSAPGAYDITLNSPADANYNIIGTTNGTLTINQVDIALSIADVSMNEDEGSATVTVVLDNAVSGGFTVDASTTDGTATAGTDYTAVTGETLTFAGIAGEEQSFIIALTPEFDEEADETLIVSLSNLLGTTLPVDITDQATVTIANDDVASAQFIITMETTMDNEEINVPTTGSSYNYVVDWGDGLVEGNLTGDKTHTYVTTGTYTIRITGDFPRIYFKGAEDAASDANALKLKSIEQWGTNTWSSMNGAFEGAMNMAINATDAPDLSITQSLEEMFSDCDALTNNDFTHWDVSNITSMKEMFERTDNFNGDLSNWDVSNVTDMEQMFKDALAFSGDITGWNTGKVEDMNRMFQLSDQSPAGSVMSFNQNIGSWDVSSVTNFNSMFEDNTVFNQGLNSWNVSNAKDMEDMFRGASALNGNISDWNVSSVSSMNGMLAGAAAFNQDISKWNVGAVEDMEEMFDGAALFNADIRNWDVSSVTSMKDMFEDATAFNANISGWTTTALTDMEGMFLRASAFNQDISAWNISGLTALERVFENADAFNQDLSGWNTSAITDMSSLFEEANVFNQDISSWNVSQVTDMGDMFLNAVAFDQSLAAWDMSLADDLEDMLSGSGLSTANYDATLTGWAAQTLQSGVTLGATGLNYCASLADRQSLIDDDTWNINGDSQACETVVTITDIGGVEDDGDITVTLTSSQAIIGGFTIDVSTADGTATASTDYTAVTSQTITFAGNVGETQTFIISPTADSDDEPNETILVNIGNLVVAAGNTVDITDQGTVTIFNEDVATAFFTTVWETTVDNQSITVPTNGEGYSYRIDWGDATIEKNQTGDATHTYATAGAYTVKIVGAFPRMDFNNSNSNNAALLKSVEQWGTIEWQSMENAFRGVANLSINAPSAPNLSNVTSMRSMFSSATNMNDDISGWDVSQITDMAIMFQSASSFNQDIGDWDVSQVTDMAGMFNGATVFNQPLNAWNVGKVISMEVMFQNADAFDQDLNSWDVSKVEKFDHMFNRTDVFNGNITSWNVSSGTDFEEMFQGTKAFNQPIGSWNLTSTTSVRRMFQESEAFNQPLNDWRFPNLTSTEQMFRKSEAFNQDLNDWEMINITKIDDMFEEAEVFNGNISDWDVRNVKNFDYAFDEATNFNQDISGWDVGQGENFRNMFDEATNFNQDLSAWQVGNGTNFSRMFNSASSFDQDLSAWDVTSATNMGSMFNNSSLSIANYDVLLTAWAKQEVQNNIQLGVTGLQYCAGSNGRQSLIDVKGWAIENDGINCSTTVTIEDIMAAEDDGDITITLTSESFVADGFTVDVTTTDGTATAGTDYTAVTSETVTFFGAAGETQVFTILPTTDTNVEPDETLTVSMSNVITDANNTITATDQATVTIQNDDQPKVAFSSVSASNAETTSNADIEVTLDQAGLEAASVEYTISGTATGSGTDFTLAAGNLNFAVGDVSETISLTIINDAIVEADETMIITLSNPSGASLGTNSTFTYTIENEDEAVVSLEAVTSGEGDGDITLTATLDNAVDGGFTVDLITAESTAIKGVDYTGLNDVTLTFAGTAGETQTTTISPIDDDIFEFNEIISILFDNLANTTLDVTTGDVVEVTIEDNDQAIVTIDDVSGNEDDGDITITLQLNKTVTDGFSVDLSTTDATATASTDYTVLSAETVTFAGTAGETKTIILSPSSDTDVEGNETLSVAMSNLTGTALAITITDQATVTIIGDDQPVISFASTAASNNESTTSSAIEVALDQAGLSSITVDYVVTGTATGGGTDYTLANGTLTFAAGDISEAINLVIVNDAIIEADETVVITLSNASDASLGSDLVFTYTIINDDFNNAPTDIALSATSVAENNALDATIGSLITTDLDAANTHTYSLVNGTGNDDNDSFVIDGADLKVNNASFNFEDRNNYNIRVQTEDEEGGIFAKMFSITITNVNEEPFTISLTNNTIDEADEGQDVGSLMSLDPDNGETFSYALVAGDGDSDNALFTINSSMLRTAGAINFEDANTRSVRVRVTDAGGLSFAQSFIITIEDVVAEPVRDFTQNALGADVKNVFSPNGDGVNETWVIEDLLDNPFNEVKVFAQGGKLIYNKVNYTNDWGGTFKDDPVPDGTYYYEIAIFENSQSNTPARVIKGFLTIIRSR